MADRKPRYLISVNDRMLNEIETFQEENNFSTRSGAIQELIRLGLEAVKEEEREKELKKKERKK